MSRNAPHLARILPLAGLAMALAAPAYAQRPAPREPGLIRVCAEIRALGRRAAPLVADITDEDQVIAAVEASNSALGPVDCMVTVVGH